MAIGIALAAEEHGKIVSARHFCNAAKSYLPTHGTFHKIAHWALCIFANAIRKECAEAKLTYPRHPRETGQRNSHGVRRGKVSCKPGFPVRYQRNSHGVRRGKGNSLSRN